MIEQISLNSIWKFKVEDAGTAAENYRNAIPECSDDIRVPSCWNELREELFHYEGPAWYYKEFKFRKTPGISRNVLFFYGVNYKCEVWLNGSFAGAHTGGYTPFEIDVTALLKPEAENLLAVRVDNTLNKMTCPPIGVDWFNYGGIYREVYLNGSGESWMDEVAVVTGMDGKVNITVDIGNYKSGSSYTIDTEVFDDDELAMASSTSHKSASAKSGVVIEIASPRLWSLDSPFMYRFSLVLRKDNTVVDRWEHRIGIREFSIKDRKLILNGKPIVLKGYAKHEEYPMLGRTYCRDIVRKDYDIMKQGNANFVRLCHYPHDLREYETASEMGFLAIAEVPNVNFYKEHFLNKELMDLAVNQLKEFIKYYRNETCILFWSLFIECRTYEDAAVDFVPKYIKLLKELDPTRFSIHASDIPTRDRTYDYFDVVGVNYWDGWYFGDTIEGGSRLLDEIASRYPEKPLVMTSGGWEGIYGFHSYKAKMYWSEERQADYLDELTQMYISKEYVVGEIVWMYNDCRTMPWLLDEGDKFRGNWPRRPFEINNKGVVDLYRRPKLSYYRLQDTFRRWDERLL